MNLTKRLVRLLEWECLHHTIDIPQFGESDCLFRIPSMARRPRMDGKTISKLYSMSELMSADCQSNWRGLTMRPVLTDNSPGTAHTQSLVS